MCRRTEPSDGASVLIGFDVHLGSRLIGRLSPSKTTYWVWRSELSHFCRVADGYGIEEALCGRFFARGSVLERIVLVLTHADGQKRTYVTPRSVWQAEGRVMTLGDFGPQRFLSFDRIRTLDRVTRQTSSVYEPPASAQEIFA